MIPYFRRLNLRRLNVSLLAYWGCLLGTLYLFAELAGEVYEREGFFFDAPILDALAAHQTAWLVGAARTLSTVASPLALGSLATVLALYLGFRHRRAAVFLGGGFGGAMLLNLLFKLLFARVRPALFGQLTLAPGFSFPSGHAMNTTVVFAALYLAMSPVRRVWRTGLAVVGGLTVLSVSASRLYLQIHYPSDVVAGIALGTAWVLALYALWTPKAHPAPG